MMRVVTAELGIQPRTILDNRLRRFVARLKSVFVLPSLHGGGAERAAVTLLAGLPEA